VAETHAFLSNINAVTTVAFQTYAVNYCKYCISERSRNSKTVQCHAEVHNSLRIKVSD